MSGDRSAFPSIGSASRREWLALTLLVTLAITADAKPRQAGAPAQGRRTGEGSAMRLTPEHTVGDLLAHPAFAGFARRLLPWDDRDADGAMRLDAVAALMPYHTHIDPASTVGALNHMVDDASQGRPIYFDIYTDAERRADPAKAQTGLFFFRGRPGAPFAVVAPGGGFAYVGSLHEGFPYADAISRAGFNAFVLKYRAGRGQTAATQDLAAALGIIFDQAAQLGVDTRGYSLWGSSAGARMAAAIGSHGARRFGGPDLPRPATVVMAYTSHSDIGDREPPTFAIVGERDGISPPAAMRQRVDALRRAGTEVAFRECPRVGHGFGLGVGTSAEGWIDEAIRFWARHQPR